MIETTPTNDIEAAFAYAQTINDLYSLGSGFPECESISQEETDRHAITLLRVGVWAFPDPQDAFRAETALYILHKHVGHEVESMYRMIKTLDKFNEFQSEACRMWIPDYAERLKQLHYDLNGGRVWLSEDQEHRFSDARVRLWELKEKLDVLAAYKLKVEQEGFECFYLYPADNVSLNDLFNKSQENGKCETENVSEPYLVIQNQYDPVEGWHLLGYLEVEETVKTGSSQTSTPHRVSKDILFHTPNEKLRILSGAPMKLPLLPSSAPITSGVRTVQGIFNAVDIKMGGNGLFVAYTKE
jgi:hypothetical protein